MKRTYIALIGVALLLCTSAIRAGASCALTPLVHTMIGVLYAVSALFTCAGEPTADLVATPHTVFVICDCAHPPISCTMYPM